MQTLHNQLFHQTALNGYNCEVWLSPVLNHSILNSFYVLIGKFTWMDPFFPGINETDSNIMNWIDIQMITIL